MPPLAHLPGKMSPESSYTGADLFIDTLVEYGVEHMFGNPGTTELPIIDALTESELEYILGLHEDIAVGMASGYARRRRHDFADDQSINPVGVVNLHVTPGMAHGIGNLHGAHFAGSPLVITAGNHSTDFQHESAVLSGDLEQLTSQFTKWSAEVKHINALPTMLRRAFRVALTPPTGPVFLGLPLNVMMEETDRRIEPLGQIPNAGRGDEKQIRRAASLLEDIDDIVLVVGDKVARSPNAGVDAAVQLAETAGAKVHSEIATGEVNFPGDHDQWISMLPDHEKTAATLLDADAVILAGCVTNTTTTRHELDLVQPDSTVISINDDPASVGKNHTVDAGMFGDLGSIMTELASELSNRLTDEEKKRRCEAAAAYKSEVTEKLSRIGTKGEGDVGLTKAEFIDTLKEEASDAFVVDEGVTTQGVMYVRWNFKSGKWMANKGGGLGYGVPAAIGAALAESKHDDPDDVLCIVGDGSFNYYPQAVYSAARHDLDLSIVVSNNGRYRILIDNMIELMGGTEKDYADVNFDFDPEIRFSKITEGYAGICRRAETPSELKTALNQSLSESGPSVIDTIVKD